MRNLILAAAIVAAPAIAFADGADGVWKTEADDNGGYLEVTIATCESDAAKTCGTITSAFTKEGTDPKYVNLGKLIVTDMTSINGKHYSGGTIWDPEHDKTYSSKMTVKGDVLDVEGCISIICSGEDWTRVK
jgi:uncharacterized protein (DUF2147 family)